MLKHRRFHIGLIAALVMAVAMLALAFTLFAIDRGTSYVQTPSVMLAVTSEDVVSPLAATGSSVVTIADSSIAIASETVTAATGSVALISNSISATTPVGLPTTVGLLLLAAIGVLYLTDIGTGPLHRLARRASPGDTTTPTNTPTTIRKLFASVTRLGSQGGAAYAMSIAVLTLAVIGGLVQTTGTSLA